MDPSPPHSHIGAADGISREGQQEVHEIQHWDLALLATLAEDGRSGLLVQQQYLWSHDANPSSRSSSSSLTSLSDAAPGMGVDSLVSSESKSLELGTEG